MNANLRYIILWRDQRTSGAIFVSGLIVFIALLYYSVLVVATCLAIPCLIITIGLRILFAAKCFLLKKPVENPFQYWLAEEWEISGDKMDSINKKIANMVNRIVLNLKKKLLVEDFVDSLKGLIFSFTWYYIGKNISGMTLLFIGYVGLFTIPKLCDIYRRELDTILKMVNEKYDQIVDSIVERIPSLARQRIIKSKKFKPVKLTEDQTRKEE